MFERLVNIVIPIYKKNLDKYEDLSFRQICNTFSSYDITIIKPEKLNLDFLLDDYENLKFESFDDSYFRSVHDYNRLMMSEGFYTRFTDYKYILIAQLDAYVFRDELKQWCDKDYDYIGAPWLVRPIYSFPVLRLFSYLKYKFYNLIDKKNSRITRWKVGNGGFSLRKVEKHLEVTRELSGVISHYLNNRGHLYNEDVFFSIEVNKYGMGFKYPDYMEALKFSFDKYPDLCYKINNYELPFACHGWSKRKMLKFWSNIILQ